ncbi:hypothetical protein B0H11DRAFT_1761014 [Mycena galericulata]|nr:hypothetical protein B0H11DRAFT_1761014 [Mycena galericulata]
MASLEYLRTEMLTWANALSAYDSGDFRGALRLFEPISDTSKILINMAFVSERLGERAQAIEHFTKAIELDKYLAIGYFQRGVAYFHGGQYAEAVKDFTDAQTMMRTNSEINYNVLGLDYKLKLPEILFNKWLTLSKMGKTSESTTVLQTLRETSPPDELEAMITNAMNNPDDACPPCSAASHIHCALPTAHS